MTLTLNPSQVSFGLLGYDMSRSQSIMRIATTASPVSGSDVRRKMLELSYPNPSPNPSPSPNPNPSPNPSRTLTLTLIRCGTRCSSSPRRRP